MTVDRRDMSNSRTYLILTGEGEATSQTVFHAVVVGYFNDRDELVAVEIIPSKLINLQEAMKWLSGRS